jgi:hypothetical protein
VTEHQFINLGAALHPETLQHVLTDLGVKFELAPD